MNSTEVYSVTQDQWTDIPDCLHSRCEHSSIMISTDEYFETVYLLGGKESAKKTYSDAFDKIQKFDLKGKTKWEEVVLIGSRFNFSQQQVFLSQPNQLTLFGGQDKITVQHFLLLSPQELKRIEVQPEEEQFLTLGCSIQGVYYQSHFFILGHKKKRICLMKWNPKGWKIQAYL